MGSPSTHRLVGLASLAALALAPAARAQPALVEAPPPAPPVEALPPQAPPVAAPPPAPPVAALLVAAPPPQAPPVETLLEAARGRAAGRRASPPRPRLSMAVGMGATRDATGFPDGAHLIPAFFATGGFGDGFWGIDLGVFSSSASGRFSGPDQVDDSPVDRLALDAFGVVRPFARVRRDDQRYGLRVVRTIGAELGFGLERDSRVVVAGSRWEIHTGARIELPLTPAGEASELRLRFAFRRAIGLYTPKLSGGSAEGGITSVGDSNELYAALAVVF